MRVAFWGTPEFATAPLRALLGVHLHGLEAAARVRCPARLVLGGKDFMTLPKAAQALATAGLRTAIDMVRAQGLPVPIVEFTVDDVVRSGACAMWVRAFAEHEAVRMAAECRLRVCTPLSVGRCGTDLTSRA